MDTPRYRIGNDLTVFWAIHNRDGSPFDMEGKEVHLYVTNERGRREEEAILTNLPDGTINNVIRWDYKGGAQRVLGLHTLTVEILESSTHREMIKDYCEAFILVSRSEMETDEADANISIGGDLVLSSKLDIYRFEATNADLSGIKESIHKIGLDLDKVSGEAEGIKDEVGNVKISLGRFESDLQKKAGIELVEGVENKIAEAQESLAVQVEKVEELDSKLKTKASIESVELVSENLATVNTAVEAQAAKVGSLESEISLKASSEKVEQIASNLSIASESIAEQAQKVNAIEAEVQEKASKESVNQVSESLGRVSLAVEGQATQIGSLGQQISEKASAELVAEIAGELASANESIAEQGGKIGSLETEVAGKASIGSVQEIGSSLAVIGSTVEGQTSQLRTLEESLATKVSQDLFNEKTAELNTAYSSLKETTNEIEAVVGEQKDALSQVQIGVKDLNEGIGSLEKVQEGTTSHIATLGSFAYKNALAVSDIPDLSGKYLPLSGGTIEGNYNVLTIKRNENNPALIGYSNANGALGWLGFNKERKAVILETDLATYRTLLHSGNVGEYNAGSADRLAHSYSENINYGSYTSDLRLIRTNDGNGVSNGFPGDYFSGLSVLAGYTGWQMVTYGDSAYPNPHFRSIGGGGNWSSWKQLAFTDSNVASADYASNAGTLGGVSLSNGSNTPWGTIPMITKHGWMDVGKHFEFHYDNTTGSDYSTVLSCTGNHGNFVNLPSASGTLALLTDNVASATKLATARTIWGQSFDGTGDVEGDLSIKWSKIYWNADTNNYYIGWNSSEYAFDFVNYYGHRFHSKGSERMRITADGNVLIGTTTDNGAKLYVNGTFRCNALRTNSAAVTYWGISDEGILSWDTTYASVMAKSGLALRLGIDGTPYITIASNGAISMAGAVTMASTLSVGGASTFTGKVSASGGIDIPNGQQLAFLDASGNRHTIAWDSASNGILIDGNLIVLGELATGLPMQEIPSIPEIGV